jgi:Ca-activated chloride channel family protein
VPEPEAREPIAASLEVASAPWEPRHRLVRIALKARDLPAGGRGSIVARDVAVQVEFSPAQVQAYRLLGYENPGPAGGRRGGGTADVPDIRPGQSITAFYEVVPASESPVSQRLLTVTVRYRMPDGGASRSLEFPLVDKGAAFADASRDFKFAAAVAEFGLVLRDSPYKAGASMADVLHWAEQAAGADPDGHRGEFIALVKRAGTVLASQG